MRTTLFKTILALLIIVLAPLVSVPASHAAPGDYLFEWGANYHFSAPHGVALDSSGNVYVTNTGNQRIQKFNSSGAYTTQWGSSGSGDGQFSGPRGIAVDQSGNVYVVDTGNQRIQKFNSSGAYTTQWGSMGSGDGQFQNPRSLAVDGSGNIYVADANNHRIQKFNSSGAYITQWGSFGSGDGQFRFPNGVAVDSVSGDVYVADTNNQRIQKFNSTGGYITQWGSFGSGDGQFFFPAFEELSIGMAVDSVSGDIYVADTQNSRIQKFNSSGAYITQWGSNGSGDGLSSLPIGVAIDDSGDVYVVETNNGRIQKFNSSGAYLTQWRSNGSGDGQFLFPYGVAVNVSGNVYVADTENHRIQKFDSSGTYLTQLGINGSGDGQFNSPRGVAVDDNSDVFVADTLNHRIQKFDISGNYLAQWGINGSGDGQFNYPYGVVVDGSGNVYVADTGNNRIQNFDSFGAYFTQWGILGPGDGQFSSPVGVAVDVSGYVYVVDTNKHRIQNFDSFGTYLTQWGSFGSGDGQFSSPAGIAIDGNGNVYVVDTGNNRIQVFDNTGTFIGGWGSYGSGDGQFDNPSGLATNATGTIVYVADSNNNRIQAFEGFGGTTYVLTYTAGANGAINGSTPQTVNSGGSGTPVTAVANSGYRFVSWSDGVTTAARTDTNVTANINVTASFAVKTFTLTYTAGANGAISGSTPQTVNSGGSGTPVTAVANSGYRFVSWSDGVTTAARTDANVTANINVTASFAPNQLTVTFVAGAGGSISGRKTQTVTYGGSTTQVSANASYGKNFVNWTGTNGFVTTTANPLVLNNVVASQTVTANFSDTLYTLTFVAGANGSVSGTSPQTVIFRGNSTPVTAVPNVGYHLLNWTGTGGFRTTTANPLTVSRVVASQTITANFAINQYTIRFSAGRNGSISGTARQTVDYGGSTTSITAVPNSGRVFVNWTGNNGFITTTSNPLVLNNITANQQIRANFR